MATSRRTTRPEKARFHRGEASSRSDAGFTLIELLVVVALIAIITVLALPSIGSYFRVSLGSATREMATTIKETYNTAVITGHVYRIALDIQNGQYWVEAGPDNALLETTASKEKEERRKRFARLSEKAPESQFSMDKGITRSKISLPRGVKFEDVITQQSKEPITEGMAYAHFFPHGLTEQAILHLSDTSNHKGSLVLTPLTGRTDYYERYVTPEEIFGK